MRISDWSSDVCSSDLGPGQREQVNWGRWIVSVFRTGAAGLFATTALLASASAHAQVAAPNAGDASVAETRMSSSTDRKSVVEGKSLSVRLVLGGRRIIKKKKSKCP